MDLLERMRAKPRHVKHQYAFGGALLITLVIASFWVLSLPARFSTLTNTTGDVSATSGNEQDGFSNLVGSARDELGSLIEAKKHEESNAQNITPETNSGEQSSIGLVDTATSTRPQQAALSAEDHSNDKIILIATTSSSAR